MQGKVNKTFASYMQRNVIIFDIVLVCVCWHGF